MPPWTGIAAFAVFFWLGCIRKIEPFSTYFYLFAWGSYLWTVNRVIRNRAGQSASHDWRSLVWLMTFSTTLWCFFELLNFRLNNWSYIGVPHELWLRWPGYALSFATVAPGILWTSQLLNCHPPRPPSDPFSMEAGPSSFNALEGGSAGDPSLWIPPLQPGGMTSKWIPAFAGMTTLGLTMILLPLLWPRLFFPLIWGGIFFLVEPYVQKSGGHSLIADWRAGRWRTTKALLMSGLMCGLFWEACNYWAGSKWAYRIPYWDFGRVFEMPVLGFLGFPPFALEVHVIHQAAALSWKRSSLAHRRIATAAAIIFCLIVFWGIDQRTVSTWR